MDKTKGTTIFVSRDIHEDLILLKVELKRGTYTEVISDLIRVYREIYGWSATALADELRKLGDKDADNI